MTSDKTVLFEKILAARKLLKNQAHITPVVTSRTLNRLLGAEIFLKCENFQRIGAFKFRGAYNAISRLSVEDKQRGVLTFSSGNHAQATALAGRLLGIQTTIVMPKNAPAIKLEATRGYGATVIEYDPEQTNREQLTEEITNRNRYTFVHPYDNEDVVAGQGTAALELVDEVKHLDMLLTPCGGGGLLSGSAIVCKNLLPACKVIGVEPELADDATRSFRTGELHTVENPQTIADGTRTPSLGKITFPLVLNYVDDMRTVTENAIVEAVQFLFYRQKMVVEPSGALGLAALLSGAVQAHGRVGVILSGGNVDAATMTQILNWKSA